MAKEITDLLYEFNTRADITIESLADLISDIAVPVVRCKDCVWYYQSRLTGGTRFEHCRRGYGLYVDAEGFCAWGKKRLPDDDPLWEEEDD